MDAYDVAKWERCKELAVDLCVTMELHGSFLLRDKRGIALGTQASVEELYAFLCGYEHSRHPVGKGKP